MFFIRLRDYWTSGLQDYRSAIYNLDSCDSTIHRIVERTQARLCRWGTGSVLAVLQAEAAAHRSPERAAAEVPRNRVPAVVVAALRVRAGAGLVRTAASVPSAFSWQQQPLK